MSKNNETQSQKTDDYSKMSSKQLIQTLKKRDKSILLMDAISLVKDQTIKTLADANNHMTSTLKKANHFLVSEG